MSEEKKEIKELFLRDITSFVGNSENIPVIRVDNIQHDIVILAKPEIYDSVLIAIEEREKQKVRNSLTEGLNFK